VRWLAFLVGLVCLATSPPAAAKPKVAVAPFQGDKGNKVSDAIADALADKVRVVQPEATAKAMSKLRLKGELDTDAARRVQKKLNADAVVQGRLAKEGKGKTLRVAVFVHGKKPSRFRVQYKTVSSKLKAELRDQIVKRLGDDDDEVASKKRKRDDDDRDRKKRKQDDDDRRAKEDRRKRDDDDDRDRKKRKRVADDDDDDNSKSKRKRRRKHRGSDADDEMPRRVGARLDAGAFGGVRRLTYTSPTPPPAVGTRAVAARVEGEVYPFALGDTQKGPAAGLGLAGEYEKTLGLSITIPGTTTSVPIDQGHYSIGGRYRINASASTMVVLGLDYAARHYIADRTAGAIDFPDVDYRAVAPGVCLMTLVKPTVGVFARLGGQLILDTGPIQDKANYGAATVYGLDARLGADFGLSPRLALRVAGYVGQISFTFKGNGDMAMARGVTAAVDREFGLATTLAVTY